MTAIDRSAIPRRLEAERLVALARTMLTDPTEEIVTIFLDHAIDALHSIEADDFLENGPQR